MTALTGRRVLCSLTLPHICKGIYYMEGTLHRINLIPENIRAYAINRLTVLIPYIFHDTL
jgi:hypothetical protein